MLSVVIPVFNERNTIEEIIRRVEAEPNPKEIIVVDDGSTDGTREILTRIAEESRIKAFYHDMNMGKGAALRTGFGHVTGDIIIVQDADLEYDPQEYSKLINPILYGKADVVYGSRFMGGEPHRVIFFWHMLGNKMLTFISNMFTNLNLTDMENCFKVFKKEVLEKVKVEENRFGFDPEITAKFAKMGLSIYEVGVSYCGRSYKDGKKIGWKDGVSVLRAILKYNILR